MLQAAMFTYNFYYILHCGFLIC